MDLSIGNNSPCGVRCASFGAKLSWLSQRDIYLQVPASSRDMWAYDRPELDHPRFRLLNCGGAIPYDGGVVCTNSGSIYFLMIYCPSISSCLVFGSNPLNLMQVSLPRISIPYSHSNERVPWILLPLTYLGGLMSISF
jgi:hypothetical protein